ncbi:type I-E CRISPR-associated protein Cas5/CasD [Micromonospora sp. KLBMP9576]|uniref:type I-E CRISPR-associated protein Cas5/CasD n=1 Tax=Micromonospora sp. KLBMP9576 TaxID=3424769 RepID=UPI003D8E4DC3
MTDDTFCLVLRMAGPLQSWGGRSQFNRRDTLDEPTKSGVLGLLAAAQGLRRQDSIDDLLGLCLGVRTDQPGTLLRDYHTVSDFRGRPLLSASVNAKGLQKLTSPAKLTHVTHRFYLQDAVFVVAVSGRIEFLRSLVDALREPAFPLALGRRSCPPTMPLLLTPDQTHRADSAALWTGGPAEVLTHVPWQASDRHRASRFPRNLRPSTLDLPITVDDDDGNDVRVDVPHSFDPLRRGFSTRRVRQEWARVSTGWPGTDQTDHDPFALLGW